MEADLFSSQSEAVKPSKAKPKKTKQETKEPESELVSEPESSLDRLRVAQLCGSIGGMPTDATRARERLSLLRDRCEKADKLAKPSELTTKERGNLRLIAEQCEEVCDTLDSIKAIVFALDAKVNSKPTFEKAEKVKGEPDLF